MWRVFVDDESQGDSADQNGEYVEGCSDPTHDPHHDRNRNQIRGHADDPGPEAADEEDTRFLTGVTGQLPFPGDFYRSMMLKPVFNLMTPV